MARQERTPHAAGIHLAVGSLLVGALVLASATPAFAWANRADLFGTHDWVLSNAVTLAEGRGADWVDLETALLATDDPDTVFHDNFYHAYDIWGETYGDAPGMVADRYNEVVKLLRAGDRAGASKRLGWLSHYYSDLGQPLHTDYSVEEKLVHKKFEVRLAREMTATETYPDWVHDDGNAYVRDPYQSATQLAVKSHTLYSKLISSYLIGSLWSPMVQGIAGTSLDRAVNGMADLITSASADAGLAIDGVEPLPAAVVTRPAASGPQGAGKLYTFSGTLKARHKAGTRAVVLYCSKYAGKSSTGITQWAPRKAVLATVSDSGTEDSRYQVSFSLPGKGSWRISAVHSDAGHRRSRSAYRYVKVR